MAARKFLALFLCLLFTVPAAMIAFSKQQDLPSVPSLSSLLNGTAAEKIEAQLTENFPGADRLCDLTASIQTFLGRNQQNGCFYSEDGILENLDEASDTVTQINLSALASFSQETTAPCFFLLLPTSAAIEQSKIPDFALESLFNQKQYIQNCYSALSSSIRTIDGYGALFPHQKEYLYYRTESALTAGGCYYLYAGAGEKLGYSARSMDEFSVAHYAHDHLGDLAEKVPYSHVKGDVVSLFYYDSPKHTIRISPDPLHRSSAFSLYDPEAADSEDPLSIHLGSYPVCDLSLEGTSNEKRLLVYTDSSCDPLFPLLASHYQYIRVVDLMQVTDAELERIRPDGYDQVLFCFSVGTFGYDRTVGNQLG